MKTILLITPATASVASELLSSTDLSNRGVTIALTSSGSALANAEEATVEYTTDNGATWDTLILDGVTQRLSATTVALTIVGPLLFRVSKGITANPVGISLIF
jgi:hypothetical protein